ncbi:MAG: S-methyl-5-thioribose-1-phosphate isomerase [Bacilli bacterium]
MGLEKVEWTGAQQPRPVALVGGCVRLIDQTRLPQELSFVDLHSPEEVWQAIARLKVRGAPAIGMAAAYGLYVGLAEQSFGDSAELGRELERIAGYLQTARPTAVNLAWAMNRLRRCFLSHRQEGVQAIKDALRDDALAIQREDETACGQMGEHLLTLMRDGMGVLTHCNAGALATSQYGTALAGLYAAHERGWRVKVFADETRPVLQGARLTAWELQRAGVDVTLICDNMAATVMAQKKVHAVMVGADRIDIHGAGAPPTTGKKIRLRRFFGIAANGDAANKIGTLNLAVLASHFHIPFYVAAPQSTIDPDTATGSDIPIEERAGEEVVQWQGIRLAPEGISVYNPAFDVTPHELVTAIITEQRIWRPPFAFSGTGGG